MSLPSKWRKATIGDLCKSVNGHGFAKNTWAKHGLPIIRIQNLNGSRQFNYFAGEAEADWIVEPGDLLFAWAGVRGISFGPCLWHGKRGVLNQHIFRLDVHEDISKQWLFEALVRVTPLIEKRAHGFKSNFLHVQRDDVLGQIVHVPPREEQDMIALVSAKFDFSVGRLRSLIRKLRRRRDALATTLLTGDRRFGQFRQDQWAEVQLGDVVRPISRPVIWSDDDEYRLASVRRWAKGVFDRGSIYGRDIKVKTLFTIHTDNILISHIQAAYGAIARVPAEFDGAHVSSTYTVLDAIDGCILPEYLGHLFATRWMWHQAYLASNGFFAERLRLCFNEEDFLNRRISFPISLDEQASIARTLTAADREIELVGKLRGSMVEQKRGWMQRLLTGEVRVTKSMIDRLLSSGAQRNGQAIRPTKGAKR